MARILLIRHGRTDLLGKILCGRTPGISLNQEGRKQAETLGRLLHSRCPPRSIFSSPLERTIETAELISAPGRLPVHIDPSFNEFDFGGWTGRSFEELDGVEDWKAYNRLRSQMAAPGGESLLDVQARASAGLRRVQQASPDSTVAIVTHADVIRALLLQVLGMPLDFILRLEIAPASVSELELGAGEPRVLAVNRIYP